MRSAMRAASFKVSALTLLHLERPKLHTILAFLSAIELLKRRTNDMKYAVGLIKRGTSDMSCSKLILIFICE